MSTLTPMLLHNAGKALGRMRRQARCIQKEAEQIGIEHLTFQAEKGQRLRIHRLVIPTIR